VEVLEGTSLKTTLVNRLDGTFADRRRLVTTPV